MSMRQLGNVLRIAGTAVLFGDIRDALIEDICGADWDVGEFVDVPLNDIWENDERVRHDLLTCITGGRKRPCFAIVDIWFHFEGCHAVLSNHLEKARIALTLLVGSVFEASCFDFKGTIFISSQAFTYG